MELELTGAKPYDGRYRWYLGDELTTTEWGWIKRFSGYLPLTVATGIAGGDSELFLTYAVIALCRAGKIQQDEVPAVFERLAASPFAKTISLHDDDEPVVEDDAGPPALSSNGSESTSGLGSPTSSERSEQIPSASGTPAWAISQSAPPTSES